LFRECRDDGMHSKCWKTRAGRHVGGGPLTKSLVNHILHNPIYVGDIRHREKSYPGLHLPIIDRETFETVQKIRAVQANKKAHRNRENILTGILFDCFGRPMCMNRNFVEGRFKKPSRFYMSLQNKWGKRENLKRLRARGDDLESLICTTVQAFLGNQERLRSLLLERGIHDRELSRLARTGPQASKRLEGISRDRLGAILAALIVRIELSLERVKVVLRCCEVERFLRWDGVGLFKPSKADWDRSSTVLIDVPAGAIRYKRKLMIPLEPRRPRVGPHPRPNLKALIKEARELQRLVDAERDKTLEELATQSGLPSWRFARVLRLNYLAPDIVTSIIDGTQPSDLTRTKLTNAVLPMDWALQRKLLGFPDHPTLEGCE
jgi:site-specific DNA recombinase